MRNLLALQNVFPPVTQIGEINTDCFGGIGLDLLLSGNPRARDDQLAAVINPCVNLNVEFIRIGDIYINVAAVSQIPYLAAGRFDRYSGPGRFRCIVQDERNFSVLVFDRSIRLR